MPLQELLPCCSTLHGGKHSQAGMVLTQECCTVMHGFLQIRSYGTVYRNNIARFKGRFCSVFLARFMARRSSAGLKQNSLKMLARQQMCNFFIVLWQHVNRFVHFDKLALVEQVFHNE